LNEEEKQKLWSLVQEIRAELEPVIDHLLDIGHELNANRLLHIRDSLLERFNVVFEDKQEEGE